MSYEFYQHFFFKKKKTIIDIINVHVILSPNAIQQLILMENLMNLNIYQLFKLLLKIIIIIIYGYHGIVII